MYPKEKEAELRKQERLRAVQASGRLPIEYRFLTIDEIREEDMLLSEQIRSVPPRDLYALRIEKMMRPGACSEEGFLSPDEKLYDVYLEDDETLKRLGATYGGIADRLDEIVKSRGLHENLTVEPTHYWGWQECPFGCSDELGELGDEYRALYEKTTSSSDYTVTNGALKESVFFSGLHSHLVRDHHFFEGHTKYRLDPEQCVRVLEI